MCTLQQQLSHTRVSALYGFNSKAHTCSTHVHVYVACELLQYVYTHTHTHIMGLSVFSDSMHMYIFFMHVYTWLHTCLPWQLGFTPTILRGIRGAMVQMVWLH